MQLLKDQLGDVAAQITFQKLAHFIIRKSGKEKAESAPLCKMRLLSFAMGNSPVWLFRLNPQL